MSRASRPKCLDCIALLPTFALAFATVFQPATSRAEGPTYSESTKPRAGVCLSLISENPHEPYEQYLQEIRTFGASDVSLVVPLYQATKSANRMAPHPLKTPSDGRLVQLIAAAHAAKLRVLVFPMVLLEGDPEGGWRGNLAPTDRAAWFAAYEDHIVRLARLAAGAGADSFSVGSEFATLESDEAVWRHIVAQTRAVFPRTIHYTANWDTFTEVRWWDAVDALAISAYYELLPIDETPTPERLRHGWLGWREYVEHARERIAPGKPIIFTEVGYPSVRTGAAEPWNYVSEAPADNEVQRLAFQAFCETWTRPSELQSFYIWQWREFGKDAARSYPIQGKPAEAWLSAWIRRAQPASAAPAP